MKWCTRKHSVQTKSSFSWKAFLWRYPALILSAKHDSPFSKFLVWKSVSSQTQLFNSLQLCSHSVIKLSGSSYVSRNNVHKKYCDFCYNFTDVTVRPGLTSIKKMLWLLWQFYWCNSVSRINIHKKYSWFFWQLYWLVKYAQD